MINLKFYLLLLIIVSITSCGTSYKQYDTKEINELYEFVLLNGEDGTNVTIFNNEEVALEHGKKLLELIYVDFLDSDRPINCTLINDTWFVYGSTPASNYIGGAPYLIMNKNNGKIEKIMHTK